MIFLPQRGVSYPRWFCIFMAIAWLVLTLLLAGITFNKLSAQERFGFDAEWQLVEGDHEITKFATENDCWEAYFDLPAERRRDAYCEPEDKWLMIEQSEIGVNTTGFKSEFGCFLGGIVASHQQGVGAQCMYLGDTAGFDGKAR
jgi:hypothetical protein